MSSVRKIYNTHYKHYICCISKKHLKLTEDYLMDRPNPILVTRWSVIALVDESIKSNNSSPKLTLLYKVSMLHRNPDLVEICPNVKDNLVKVSC